MIRLEIVLTDSGETGKWTFFRVRPALVVRDLTKHGETVHLGRVKLVGADRQKILEETERVLGNLNEYLGIAEKNAISKIARHGKK